MNQPIQPSDPITLVFDTHVIILEVLAVSKTHIATSFDARLRAEEGVTWIRGEHLRSSAEVKAAILAQALRAKERAERSPPPVQIPPKKQQPSQPWPDCPKATPPWKHVPSRRPWRPR